MTRSYWLTLVTGLALFPACGDDAAPSDSNESSGSSGSESGGSTTTSSSSSTAAPGSSSEGEDEESSSSTGSGEGPAEADFLVRIENVSGESWLPVSFSPGAWIEHPLATSPVFSDGQPDRGEGLELLAEDGQPNELTDALEGETDVLQVGVFEIPIGGKDVASIAPGEAYEFAITSSNGGRLSFFTKVLESNDVALGTGPLGVALWTNSGAPLPERDVTSFLELWDVGTEADQPPGAGGNQPGPDREPLLGPPEGQGAVSRFSQATRQLPPASKIGRVDVTYDEKTEEYTITLINEGASLGAVFSPFSPAIWALHGADFSLFEVGAVGNTVAGLEALAERGDPSVWVTAIEDAPGVTIAQATADGADPDGGSITITVNPGANARFFSLATAVVETNDAFLGTPTGVALLDEEANRRPPANVEADFAALLGLFDAGTEANEVPGRGLDQPPREGGTPSGPADPINTIRFYSDTTNDLDGPLLGGLLTITVVPTEGGAPNEFTVTVQNTSGNTSFPALFSPLVFAVHDDALTLFEEGVQAAPALEALAEDGDPRDLLAELADDAFASGIPGLVGDALPSAIGPGDSFEFVITANPELGPFLSLATGLIPSNDTFGALISVPLFDDVGAPLSAEALAAAVASALLPYDAGTELTQAGAIGRDQAPRGIGGEPEGPSLIRPVANNLVWGYPDPRSLVQVTISPLGGGKKPDEGG